MCACGNRFCNSEAAVCMSTDICPNAADCAVCRSCSLEYEIFIEIMSACLIGANLNRAAHCAFLNPCAVCKSLSFTVGMAGSGNRSDLFLQTLLALEGTAAAAPYLGFFGAGNNFIFYYFPFV